jgi:hypothetical protein
MLTPKDFFRFQEEKGISLKATNPHGDEWGLSPANAVEAVRVLDGAPVVVAGFDVLTLNDGKRDYLYWLNWSVKKQPGEHPADYAARSQREAIQKLEELSTKVSDDVLVILVTAAYGLPGSH